MTYLSIWDIMEPNLGQDRPLSRLVRNTVIDLDPRARNQPIRNLEGFNWLRPFRISLGLVAFTPQPINQAQGQLRSRMIQMFGASTFGSQIQSRLLAPTIAGNVEYDAYIVEPGSLVGVTQGEPRRINQHAPPAGSSPVGYVHTHPPSPQILPPTPGWDWLDMAAYPFPVQLMVESGPRRVWGLISPNIAFPLGLLSDAGALNELNPTHPQARYVYLLRNG